MQRTRSVSGHVGGGVRGNYTRTVISFAELLQHLEYCARCNIFRLRRGPSVITMMQLMGALMGGRLSGIFSSLLLHFGEGRLWASRALQEKLWYVVGRLPFEELVSCIRLRDEHP